jgi:hypothetical protein
MIRSSEEYERLTSAHENAIGKIVIAWNDYQEILGQMFAKLFGRKPWALALSAWHSLDSDRSQRRMLLAVAHAKLKPKDVLLAEIKWLIDNSDRISDQRNIGIHMPLMKYTDIDGNFQILPLAMYGNKKAAKMVGRDLLKEYAHYEQQIRKMLGYAVAIDFALTPRTRRRGPGKLPERPRLTAGPGPPSR